MGKSTVEYKLTWVKASEIKQVHKSTHVAQVSCWVFTSDRKLILVSKDGQKWTITAGHTESRDNTLEDAAIREVGEEAGLDILEYKEQIEMVGYFIVESINTDTKETVNTDIQVRFYLKLNESSDQLVLQPNEREDQEVKVRFASPFSLSEAEQMVKWIAKSGDYIEIKKLLDIK